MKKSREELQKELDEANAQLEQYQHRCQRLENRLRYYTDAQLKTVGLENEVVVQCKKSLDLSIDLYKQGINPFSDVADAQMNYLANMNNLLTAKAKALTSLISVYEALGGGF